MRRGVNWLIFGALGIIVAIGVELFDVFAMPALVQYQVKQTLKLENNTDAWDRFVHTPVPLSFKLYFFNVDNPDAVLKGGKPKITEIGPFVYKQHMEKVDLIINEKEDTVTYNLSVTFEYDQEASGSLTEDEPITVVNPIFVILSRVIENLPEALTYLDQILEYALPQMMGKYYTPFLKTTPREVLWTGIPVTCNQTNPDFLVKFVCSALTHILPLKVLRKYPDGNFLSALLTYKNDTLDGPYTIRRGIDDPDALGKITSWHGYSKVPFWSDEPCNLVKGSDMTLLPPFLTKDDSLDVFSSDICGSVRLNFRREVTYKDVPGFEMAPDDAFLGSVNDYPENFCYCPGGMGNLTASNGCLRTGALDVTTCFGVPVVVTFPHFYKADKFYQDMIDGFKPNKELHETYIQLEPTTGVPLKGYNRVQVNVMTKSSKGFSIIKDFAPTLFPMIWFEQGSELPDDLLSIIKDQLLKILNIFYIVKWCLIAAGILIGLVGVIMGVRRFRQDPKID